MAVRLTLLCLCCVSLWSMARVASSSYSYPVDCCLDVKNLRIPFHILKGFKIQTLEDGCFIKAVVFITTQGDFCAPPNHSWVDRWINRLKKRAHNVNRKPGDW